MTLREFVTAFLILIAAVEAPAQTPAPPSAGPRFEVVSIKPHDGPGTSSSMRQMPDGFTMVNMPVRTLITQAYGPAADILGLPGWAVSARYDVNAKVSLSRALTADERRAMMRVMLAERFNLAVHMDTREQAAYDLVFARSDRRLGRNATPSQIDCEAIAASQRAAAEAARAAGAAPVPPTLPSPPDFNAPVPECTVRSGGGKMTGEASPAGLVGMLRMAVGQPVFDKTGYTGTLKFTLEFDPTTSVRTDATQPSDLPSIFSALPDQLGFKLEPSKTTSNVVVVDRIERPSEN